VRLQGKDPLCMHASGGLLPHQPGEGLVVGGRGGWHAMQVGMHKPDSPHGHKHLPPEAAKFLWPSLRVCEGQKNFASSRGECFRPRGPSSLWAPTCMACHPPLPPTTSPPPGRCRSRPPLACMHGGILPCNRMVFLTPGLCRHEGLDCAGAGANFGWWVGLGRGSGQYRGGHQPST